MKVFITLCLASFALANSYYVLRRAVPAKGALSFSNTIPVRTGLSIKAVPSRRVIAKAASSSGKDTRKSDRSLQKPKAQVTASGPAEIYHVDKSGKNLGYRVSPGEIAFRESTHPRRPQVGGILEGKPSADEPLKVSAEGKTAAVTVITPPGGSGSIKVTSDGETLTTSTKAGGETEDGARSKTGVTKVEAKVSRPGQAFAIGFNDQADLDSREESKVVVPEPAPKRWRS